MRIWYPSHQSDMCNQLFLDRDSVLFINKIHIIPYYSVNGVKGENELIEFHNR